MADYNGQTVQMATTSNSGVIEDHLDVSPDFGSDFMARDKKDTSLRRYSGFLRKDFDIADGPVPDLGLEAAINHPRNYQNTSIEFRDLPLEDALFQAGEITQRESVVLYLEREHTQELPSPCYREIVWHPKRWELRRG